mmetsp:Transcript_89281/g.251268  ORF Transcript_89281/g.251268 Transcript_89281/m.251268 type:complete len:637 (-) Transcript_89281:108-2018(-)
MQDDANAGDGPLYVSMGLVRSESRVPCRLPNEPLHFLPPSELRFDMFFFRQLFDYLEKGGYASKDHKIHIIVLRNVSVKLMDLIGLNGLHAFDKGFFAGAGVSNKTWFSWKDVIHELDKEGVPEMVLNFPERVYMTLDDPSSSQLARLFSLVMAAIIMLNLGFIILDSLRDGSCGVIFGSDEDGKCGGVFQTVCMVSFSIEYLTKLFTVPFVRVELFDTHLIVEQVVPSHTPEHFGEEPPLSPVKRLARFVLAGMNLVDLVSILPFWITVTVGEVLPSGSTSFLRILRVTRIVRILKTGRYLEMLQVLFKTLARSGRSMVVLMLFVVIIALISGVVLEQLESDVGFASVPSASYWVLAHLVSMKDVAFADSVVETYAGIVVLVIVMSLKGILWILPVGQIKTAFDEEYAVVANTQKMRHDMEYELKRPAWSTWYGLQGSCRMHLEFWREDIDEHVLPFGWASMPVPILQSKPIEAKLEVPIPEGEICTWFGHIPSINVELEWVPSAEMKVDSPPAMPSGKLTLRLLDTKDFPNTGSKWWTCRVQVPVALTGNTVETQDALSSGDNRNPVFNQERKFTVQWAPHPVSADASSKEVPVSASAECGDNTEETSFRNRVLEMLEGQGRRIGTLEALLQAK